MCLAALGTLFVGFVAISHVFLKGCVWAGWIPASLPCLWCGYPAGAGGDMGTGGRTGQAGTTW